MGNEKGFTLIELLVVIGIIGVLASISITSFSVYRSTAAYANAEVILRNAHFSVESGLNSDETLPAAVPLTTQVTRGPLTDALAADFLDGFQLPKDGLISVSYSPGCIVSSCQQVYLKASHCSAIEHIEFVRFGDGLEIRLEKINGGGCTP